MALMHWKYGVEISYHVAHKARSFALEAIRGSAEQSYSDIPSLCTVLEDKNQGSFCSYEVDSQGRFLHFFLSLAASIDGWCHGRPVISVDGSFFKSDFGGAMLIAVALDVNNHIFPFVFAIVNSENEKFWEWFFVNLWEAIGDRKGLAIVSDLKCSIPTAVELVYPASEHEICIQHLLRNLIGRFKGLKVDGLFYWCTTTHRLEDFEYFMRQMESVRPEIRQYLYEKLARKYPVLSLVESYRSLLQRWFYERRNQAGETPTHLTTRADRRLRDMEAAAHPMDVHPIDVNEYVIVDGRVNNRVNLVKRTCNCLVWQSDEFPCSHAVAAIWKWKLEPVDFASVRFRNSVYRETYNGVVYPLGDKSSWNVFEDLLNADVPARNNRRSVGRP